MDFSLDRGWSQAELSFDTDKPGNYEVWMVMLEKAFFEWTGWAYEGWVDDAWEWMLNTPHNRIEDTSGYTGAQLQSIIEAEVQAGRKLVITIDVSGTLSNGDSVIGSHAYIVERIEGNEIILINPHDASDPQKKVRLPFSDLKAFVRRIYRQE